MLVGRTSAAAGDRLQAVEFRQQGGEEARKKKL
jgi:hypothetical protein